MNGHTLQYMLLQLLLILHKFQTASAFTSLNRSYVAPSQKFQPSFSAPFRKNNQFHQTLSPHWKQQHGKDNSYHTHNLSSPTAAAALSSGVTKVVTASSSTTKMSKLAHFASLIPKHDQFYVLSSILVLSAFGIILEKKTTVGKALSVRSFSCSSCS